jgi:predicted Zn-dependent peptidase
MVAVYVRAGSRHEDPRNNGVSHFLEHLFFRGSEGYPDGRAMNALVEDCGGSLNGVTTRDHGSYFSPLHPKRIEEPVAVLGDMLARPLFKEIELEREVILEEILDEVDEDGRDIDVDNLAKRALFPGHALGLKIAGTRESVSALSEADVRAQHAKAYGARNLVLAVAGPFKHAQILELAREHFGKLPQGAVLADEPPPEPPLGPQLIKKALAYSVGAGMEGFSDCSVFEVGCACAPRKAPAALTELLRLLADLRDIDVPDDELERAKKKTRMWLEFSLDSPAEMIGWFGGGELLRPPAETFEQWTARIEKVTTADLRRVAARYFRRDAMTAVAVGPLASVSRKLRDAVESGL